MNNDRKVIRIVYAFGAWWWTNRTDNDPPACGGEFETKEEAVLNAKKRIPGCIVDSIQ